MVGALPVVLAVALKVVEAQVLYAERALRDDLDVGYTVVGNGERVPVLIIFAALGVAIAEMPLHGMVQRQRAGLLVGPWVPAVNLAIIRVGAGRKLHLDGVLRRALAMRHLEKIGAGSHVGDLQFALIPAGVYPEVVRRALPVVRPVALVVVQPQVLDSQAASRCDDNLGSTVGGDGKLPELRLPVRRELSALLLP